MHATKHLDNAAFLREQAEVEQVEWARAKVTSFRSAPRPGVTNDEAQAFIRARYEQLPKPPAEGGP